MLFFHRLTQAQSVSKNMNKTILLLIPFKGFRLIILLTLMLGLILGIGDSSSTAAQKLVKPGVTGLVSTLSDEVKELPQERISWSTYWQLCWDLYPGAKEYELQVVTEEGKSPRLKRQSDRCLKIQAASNENKKLQGLLNRELILLMHSVRLGYRVRAVLDDNQVSEWSDVMAVGAITSPKPQPPQKPDNL
jgi:hypothetical protein